MVAEARLVKTTLIIGAVCPDGVVLVSDLLERHLDGSERLTNKVVLLRNGLGGWGHAGFDYCVNNFNTRVEEETKTRPVYPEEIPSLLAETFSRLASADPRCQFGLEVLVERRGSQKSELFAIDGTRGFRQISDYLPIGSGKDAALVDLKRTVKPESSMKEVASEGYRIIMALERVPELGVGIREKHPQILYFPHQPREGLAFVQTPTDAELAEMRNHALSTDGQCLPEDLVARDKFIFKHDIFDSNKILGRKKDPIAEFFNDIDRFIRRAERQTAKQVVDAVYMVVAQAFLDSFAGKWGFLVGLAFIALTGWGFYKDYQGLREARTFIRLALAIIAFVVDIWLTWNL